MTSPTGNVLRLAAALLALQLGCANSEPDAPVNESLRSALTFYASFDGDTDAFADADYAQGNATVHTAPSWSRRSEGAAGLPGDSLVTRVAGLHGDAVEFVRASPSILYFRGGDNIAYRANSWSGTISFWLSLDPEEDLEPGYSDPIQISPNQWDDAALFVDFTQENPRQFRFAAFADQAIWNPEGRDWAEIAPEERPMVVVDEPPFERGRWTHVVVTFDRFNTGEADGVLSGYLDGELQGTLTGREQTFTWDLDETIVAVGLNYVGRFDELSMYDRALEPAEIEALYELEGGLASLF